MDSIKRLLPFSFFMGCFFAAYLMSQETLKVPHDYQARNIAQYPSEQHKSHQQSFEVLSPTAQQNLKALELFQTIKK